MNRDMWEDRAPEGYFGRAVVLWRNAAKSLRGIKVVDGLYRRPKAMREACGTGWLAVEEAVKGLARRRGVLVKKLPREIDGLGQELDLAPIDGKAKAELEQAYGALHILGCYEGVRAADEIRGGLEAARRLVERVTGRKLANG